MNNTKNTIHNTQPGLLSVIGKVNHFSLPMICYALMDILPTLTSMWILSRLGKDYIAAAGIATPTFITILTAFLTVIYAVGIKVGHSFGENKNSEVIGPWVMNGIVLALILSIPAICLLLTAPSFLLYLGQSPHLVALTQTFFIFAAMGVVPFLINTVLNQYFVAIGRPRIAFLLAISVLPLTVIFSYGLVLGQWGLPKLAMGGVSFAYLIADTLVMIASISFVAHAKWSKPFNVFKKPFGIQYKRCLELFTLGWPIGIQIGSQLAASTVVVYLVGLFGVSALAAVQITQQYVLVFTMISTGLASAVSILVSHAYGEKNLYKIKQTTWAGMIIMIIIALIFMVGFFIFPTTLVDIYLDSSHPTNSHLVQLAIYFMMINAGFIAFNGIRRILINALRGMQDTKVPMLISISCLWLIGLPLAYITGLLLHGGPVVLQLVFIIGFVVATTLIILRYRKITKSLSLSMS